MSFINRSALIALTLLSFTGIALPSSMTYNLSGTFNSGTLSGGTFNGTYSFSLDPATLQANSSAFNTGYEDLASYNVTVTKGSTVINFQGANNSYGIFSRYAAPTNEGYLEFTNSTYTNSFYLYFTLPFEGVGNVITGYPSSFYNGAYSYVGQGVSFAPEPATLPLMGLTLVVGSLATKRLRRKSKAA